MRPKSICTATMTALCHMCGMRCRLTADGRRYCKHKTPKVSGGKACLASGTVAIEWLDTDQKDLLEVLRETRVM